MRKVSLHHCYKINKGSYYIEVISMCIRMAGEEFSDHCVMKSVS